VIRFSLAAITPSRFLRVFTALLQTFRQARPQASLPFRLRLHTPRTQFRHCPQLSGGHAKCLIYFFEGITRNQIRSRHRSDKHSSRPRLEPFVRWLLFIRPGLIPDETTFVFHHPAPRVSFQSPKQNSYFTVAPPSGGPSQLFECDSPKLPLLRSSPTTQLTCGRNYHCSLCPHPSRSFKLCLPCMLSWNTRASRTINRNARYYIIFA